MQDDATIPDEARLWRRIREIQDWYKVDEGGRVRPTSAAFLDDTPHRQLSMHLADLTSVDAITQGRDAESVAEITAATPRLHQHALVRMPDGVPEPPDHSHIVICPPEGASKSSRKRAAREMASSSVWRHVGGYLRERFPEWAKAEGVDRAE